MSNAGQAILTIGGGIIGSFFGFPQLGLVLGSLAGSALFPTQLPGVSGPRLTDTRSTTAELGGPVMEVFGTDCVPGTVMYLSARREVATTEEVGGKGGPEQKQTTYSYYQSIALGLCRGPQLGLLRIWENGELVYDVREQQDGESAEAYAERLAASADYEDGFVLYLGTPDQLPDPTIELEHGAGNVPGFRGLMWIMYPDRLLRSEQGLRHPNFKFEIQDADFLTSRVYPIEDVEAVAMSGLALDVNDPMWTEAVDIEADLTAGELDQILLAYDDGDAEAVDIEADLTAGELDQILLAYDDGDAEAVDIEADLTAGELDTVLISYEDGDAEAIDIAGTLTAGTLI